VSETRGSASSGRSIRETFLATCDALDVADVPFAVVGGFAVSAWGEPRTTRGVDVILDVSRDQVADVVAELGDRGLTLRERDLADAIRAGAHATAFDERSALYHVDLRPATDADTRRTLDDRRLVEVADRRVPVASPEETVAHKLLYGSEQDLADAEGIYARQGDALDRDRLAARCKDLDVFEELEALVDRVEDAG
jgi:hypothetical protein